MPKLKNNGATALPYLRSRSRRWVLVALAIITILGIFSRVYASFSDLWLDEIWTLFALKEIHSIAEIFSRFHSSNNHHLATILLYLIGETEHGVLYRIPFVIVGILSIPLIWITARRTGELEAHFATILTAGSYLLIYFSSEARGYSLVLFFSIAAYYFLQQHLSDGRWRSASLLWLCTGLGLLSQSMFLFTIVAAFVWFVKRRYGGVRQLQSFAAAVVKCFGVPFLLLALFYVAIIRRMEIGGGPPYQLTNVLLQSLAYTFGGGQAVVRPFFYFCACAAVVLFIWSIVHLWRTKNDQWLFFVTIIFLAPAVILLIEQPEVLFVRYFLISILFGYIAAGYFLADLCRKSRMGAVVSGIIIVVFLAANAAQTARLLRFGRGEYLKAMLYMESHTHDGDTISIASDHPFRNGMLVEYYSRFLKSGKRVEFYSSIDSSEPLPLWYLRHEFDATEPHPPNLWTDTGDDYSLCKVFPYAGPSGWNWYLYKKVAR
jgi:hypothetical protein